MSDKDEPQAKPEPKTVKRLIITMTDTGDIGVQGCVNEVGLCYMLLEVAKDVIRDNRNQKSLIEAVGPISPFDKRFRQ